MISLCSAVSYVRVLILLVAAAASARGAVVERITLEGLVERSDVIALARVARTWAAWDTLTGIIWTHSELLLLEGLKGHPRPILRVSEPGGVVGDVGQTVEGVPQFAPGEEVVVFLYQSPQGSWRVRGLGQGRFAVLTNRSSMEQIVRSGAAGLSLVEGAASQGTPLGSLNGMALNEFRARIRVLVERGSDARR